MHMAAEIMVVTALALAAGAAAGQDVNKPKEQLRVSRDRVKGSIHHAAGEIGDRIRGNVKVIDARTLEFTDGTQVLLTLVAPDLKQMGRIEGKLYPCGEEAAEFLRKLIGGKPVMAYGEEGVGKNLWNVYLGDVNLEHAMVINGWALAHHSSLHAPEIIARENKRGLWRGEFVDPADWRQGQRLPGEQ